MLKKAPRRRPTVKAETYQSINQQIQSIVQQVGVEFLYVILNKLYVELEFERIRNIGKRKSYSVQSPKCV